MMDTNQESRRRQIKDILIDRTRMKTSLDYTLSDSPTAPQ